MKRNTQEQGITLIALVVTLIILVILAAVTIRAVYETKIVEYAVNGAKDYSEEAIRENEILDKTANLLDETIGGIKDNNKHEDPEEEEIDNTITEEDIGKYVAYVVPTSDNTFTSKVEYNGYSTMDYTPTTGLKWRILSKEGNKVELIAERGDNNSFYLQGYQGYNNAVALLNNACNKMYVNSELGAVTARNLKIEDIEAHYTGEGATNQEYTPTSGKYYPEIFALEEGGNVGLHAKRVRINSRKQMIHSCVACNTHAVYLSFWKLDTATHFLNQRINCFLYHGLLQTLFPALFCRFNNAVDYICSIANLTIS